MSAMTSIVALAPVALLALLALPAVAAQQRSPPSQDEAAILAPEPSHARLARQIYKMTSRHHYLRMEMDDALSERMLDSYLDAVDPSRTFLLASDVREFTDRYQHTLDDSVRDGDLAGGYEIFNRYRQRFLYRAAWALDNVSKILQAGFEAQESVSTDRENVAWPKDAAQADETWRKRIKLQLLNLRLAGKPASEAVSLLEKRYLSQKRRLGQMNSEDVFRIYTNAWTRVYDPHTSYFSEHTSKNFQINMSLSLEGIGAVLEQDDEHVKVVRLIHAGPADKQGELQPADRIVGVGQGAAGKIQDVIGWRLDEVVDRIRGRRDSIVRLEILPVDSLGEGQTKVIAITRDTVKLEEQAASKEVLDIENHGRTHRIGVIDLPTFYTDFGAMQRGETNYRSTTRDVKTLLEELVAEDVDGVIIDLRDNGGGSLAEANDLTSLFIRRGPTVQIRRKNNRLIRQGKMRSTPYYDGPLAVLINRLSASASEIFAGAIQDYKRGLMLGSVSFGKGTVQTLLQLRSGQLKVTEAKFYRISGDSTQHRGVIPDIMFPEIYDAAEVGESALDYALRWNRIPAVRHRTYYDIDAKLPALLSLHQRRIKDSPGWTYLEQRLQLDRSRADAEQVSLNEVARREQQTQRKAEDRALENQWRAVMELDPLPEVADVVDAPDAPDGKKPAAAKTPVAPQAVLADQPADLADDAVAVASASTAEAKVEVATAHGVAASGQAAEASDDADSAQDDKRKPSDEDSLLLESANILLDAMPLFRPKTALR